MRNLKNIFIVLLIITAVTFAYASDENIQSQETNSLQPKTNTYCPVMPDMKVDSKVFTDYKGKRVYFCCPKCKTSFQANPEKYLQGLPQFGDASQQAGHRHKNRGRHFSSGRLIKPLGITTLLLLILTAATGVFRRKLPRELVRWHKRFGVIALVFAIIHAALVVIFH